MIIPRRLVLAVHLEQTVPLAVLRFIKTILFFLSAIACIGIFIILSIHRLPIVERAINTAQLDVYLILCLALEAISMPFALSLLFFETYIVRDLHEPRSTESVFDSFDIAATEVLARASGLAGYSRVKLSARHILIALAEYPPASILWLRLSIGGTNFGHQLRELASIPPRTPSAGLSDNIEFDPSGEQFMATLETLHTTLPNHVIGLGDLLLAVFDADPEFQSTVLQMQLNREDIEHLARWMDIDSERIRRESRFWDLEQLLRKRPIGIEWTYGYTPLLDKITTDISVLADLSSPDITAIGRQGIINQIERTLSRSGTTNVLLVGDAGTGKRTIVEGFAQRINRGQTLPMLQYKRVLELRADTLSGSSPEEQIRLLQTLLTEAVTAGNVILFIENFHTLISTAGGLGTLNAAELLKKFLSLPTIQIIATTDTDNFNHTIRSRTDILQLMERIDVLEPSPQETLNILQERLPSIERGTVLITYQALKEVVTKSDLFIHDSPFPEKAISLLITAVSYAHAHEKLLITVDDISAIISEKTHVPMGTVNAPERQKLEHLDEEIHRELVNQESAIQQLVRTMLRLRSGITRRDKPAGTFLFIGPTGVGKTSAAKALAHAYFGSTDAMLRFDMSEYQNPESIDRFIGSTAQKEPGQFVTKVRDLPFSVILLDEIEKAHQNVINLFLQVLDEARLTDVFGKVVSFNQNIIIATSNAASEYIRELIEKQVPIERHRQLVVEYLLQHQLFHPEFLNRFDEVVVFHPLNSDQITQVARMMLDQLAARLKEQNYFFMYNDDLVEYLVSVGFEPQFGARPMQRALQNTVEVAISRKIIQQELVRGTPFYISAEEVRHL